MHIKTFVRRNDMRDSTPLAPRTTSGIDILDQCWGGLYRQGRYLAYGTSAAGRTLLTTAFVAAATDVLETSLLVSRLRQTDLAIQSASLGFDLSEAVRSGILRLSRTPFELELIDRDDDSLESSLKALSSLIIDSSADRVLVDDFSHFTRFSSFDRFRIAFSRFFNELEHVPSTLLIGMPEPANDASKRIVDYVSGLMTGCFHIHLKCIDGYSQRTISLIPQIGHLTRRVDAYWHVEHAIARSDGAARVAEGLRGPAARRPEEEETPLPASTVSEAFSYTDSPSREVQEDVEIQLEPAAREPASYEFSVEPVPDSEPTEEMVFLDRERFTEELQLYFDDFETSGSPFTLVAMRAESPRDEVGADDYRTVIGALQSVLGREDSLFADAELERLIVILGDGDSGEAQRLFGRLKSHLRETLPDRADHLLNVIAAVVVPNGKPFTTAEAFVRYVLDDNG